MTETENGGQNSNSKIHTLYILLIALLIGGLVYTNVRLKKSKETIVVTEKQRDDVSALKALTSALYGEKVGTLVSG